MDPGRPPTPEWISFLSTTEIFRGISEVALCRLEGFIEYADLNPGEILIREGDPGNCMYLIVSGTVQVTAASGDASERLLAELGPGQVAGEMALWIDAPRSATLRSTSAVRVAKLTKDQFEGFAADHPEAALAIDHIVSRRLRKNRLSDALRVSKLFGDLDEDALLEFETELELLWIEGGQTLFRQGDKGDALYLVVGGKLKVLEEREGGEPRVLAEVGRGETVGEMAVIDGAPRNATVVATRDSQVARLSKEGFERLLSGRQALLSIVARKLVGRLRELEAQAHQRTPSEMSIAIVPASSGFSHEEFCVRLSAAFSKLDASLLISSKSVDALAGKAGAAQVSESEAGNGRMMELLDKLEADHRFAIYQVDPSLSAWTRRCLRRCDHVLVAAGAEDAMEGLDVLRTLPGVGGPGVSVALLHSDSKRQPSGTRERLTKLNTPAVAQKIGQHYQVRLEKEDDFDRLARSLSGNAIGLVLGGGAARGLAHGGVIRALSEAGVPIDMIGGTSQGAISAATHALGYDPQGLLEVNIKGWEAMAKDKTIPIVSFLSGQHLSEFLNTQVGDIEIEDLWIPFFCVSANLTRARMEVHRSGPVVKSLLTSARVPGIYPPMVWDGDLLVDGGIINNVPVDVMRASPGCGQVIASDVSPRVDMPGVPDYGPAVSGWRAMREWFKPTSKRQRFPSAISVLLRTMEFGGAANAAENARMADLYLRPPMSDFKAGEYQRAGEMAELAYQYSSGKIADWLASSDTASATNRRRS